MLQRLQRQRLRPVPPAAAAIVECAPNLQQFLPAYGATQHNKTANLAQFQPAVCVEPLDLAAAQGGVAAVPAKPAANQQRNQQTNDKPRQKIITDAHLTIPTNFSNCLTRTDNSATSTINDFGVGAPICNSFNSG